MSGEIVKYSNELNLYSFGKLTHYELNILYVILHKFYVNNVLELSFSLEELKDLVYFKNKDDFKRYAFNFFVKFQEFKILIKKDSKLMSFVVMPALKLNLKTGVITIRGNELLAGMLHNITSNFTMFLLKDINEIKGEYSKKIYQLLMQFRTTGVAVFKFEDFKFILDFPYDRQRDVDTRVLFPAMAELSKYLLNLQYEKIKKRRLVTMIKFTFDPISNF